MRKTHVGPLRGWVLMNVGTGSYVDHAESYQVKAGDTHATPVHLVWDSEDKARAHKLELEDEYARTRPHLRPIDRMWKVLPATEEQVKEALLYGAFGPEYVDAIKDLTEQLRTREPVEETEAFREKIKDNPLAPRYRNES